jgi:hypothetical protein
MSYILGNIGLNFLFNLPFTYVIPSIVFDENSGVINSIKRSFYFVKKYLLTTLGVIVLFAIFSFYLMYFILFIPLVSQLLMLVTEGFKVIAFGWAFDEFKHTIK